MSDLKPLPPNFGLIKKIGEYLSEYFRTSVNPKVARSTDIYEYLKHKEDIRKRFSSAKEFGKFMKYMHLHYASVMKKWIAYKVVDTNPDFLQWYFYPQERSMIKRTTDSNMNLAKTVIHEKHLKSGRRIHRASNGQYVRSRQELHIYNTLLAEKDFAVYYERPLIANGEKRFPDFTIHNTKTRTVFYWEHFGLSENEEYMENMTEKIVWYQGQRIFKVEDGGRFIATIFVNENQFVELVDQMIGMMHEIVIPSKLIQDM
jgi:hypothetical protein